MGRVGRELGRYSIVIPSFVGNNSTPVRELSDIIIGTIACNMFLMNAFGMKFGDIRPSRLRFLLGSKTIFLRRKHASKRKTQTSTRHEECVVVFS